MGNSKEMYRQEEARVRKKVERKNKREEIAEIKRVESRIKSDIEIFKPNSVYTVRLQCTMLSVCLSVVLSVSGVFELPSLATRLA